MAPSGANHCGGLEEASIPRSPIIVWFAQDLRLHDHRALTTAVATGAPVIPLYILDDEAGGAWRLGTAARWWLHMSLVALDRQLQQRGSRLLLRRGPTLPVLRALTEETGAGAVYWTRRYEPWAVRREAQIFRELARLGVQYRRFTGGLLFEPEAIASATGEPYRVFSAFVRACAGAPDPCSPQPAPDAFAPPPDTIIGDDIEDWNLMPADPALAAGLGDAWAPGEPSARERFGVFLASGIGKYHEQRDRPDLEGTSRLSPHLHFGEISPCACWQAARDVILRDEEDAAGAEAFLRELMWREFAHHLLFHFPQLPEVPLRLEFNRFPWRRNKDSFLTWQEGMTGYPIVDAGMRELKTTGWMHNRVRMIVASFLIKHLLIPWQEGEAWFWDALVDANLANNATNWQWVAGTGADAAPYFRIFNPVLQSRKFDPDGVYIRHYVPELAKLPDKHIHAPWDADEAMLAEAGIVLGKTYPHPMVDHKYARERALAAFSTIKGRAKATAVG